MLQIQTTIVGYGGMPCTLFSAFDADTDMLIVASESDYRTQRRPGCFVLTNHPDLERDAFFSDADLKGAIEAFFTLKGGFAADGKSRRLVFAERAARANPDNSLERDGMDASGPKVRIAEGVTCVQIAALATCLHALRAGAVERSVFMAETFRRFSLGEIITI